MISKLIPVVLFLVGTGAGVGAGVTLGNTKIPDDSKMPASSEQGKEHPPEPQDTKEEKHEPEYVTLNNQFIVPIVKDDEIEALVVMSLGIELSSGSAEDVYKIEPKLRDALLQLLFDHSHLGGFDGHFINSKNMDALRRSLTSVAQSVIGKSASGVLITEIAKQPI